MAYLRPSLPLNAKNSYDQLHTSLERTGSWMPFQKHYFRHVCQVHLYFQPNQTLKFDFFLALNLNLIKLSLKNIPLLFSYKTNCQEITKTGGQIWPGRIIAFFYGPDWNNNIALSFYLCYLTKKYITTLFWQVIDNVADAKKWNLTKK